MGMSRSATSVIMFIMRLFSMKLKDAFEFVKTQREKTDPNDGFMEQLRGFEANHFTFNNESFSDSGSNAGSDGNYGTIPSCIVGKSGMRRVQSMLPMAPVRAQIGVISGGIDGEMNSPARHKRLDTNEEEKQESKTPVPKIDKQGTVETLLDNRMPTIIEESKENIAPSEYQEQENAAIEATI